MATTTTREADLRCACGSLVARITPAGIELKCRRCKRVVVVAPPPDGAWTDVILR
jgi:phage FluMu protein Com